MFHCSNKHFFKKNIAQVQSHYLPDGKLDWPLVPELARGRIAERLRVFKTLSNRTWCTEGATEGAAAETKCHMGQASVS